MATPDKPFRFLDYYDVEDSDIFFGREKETRILLADILVSRLVVLFAPTGTGKTSLINAGVRSRLVEQGYATFLVRVHGDPTASTREELFSHIDLKSPEGEHLSDQLENVAEHLGRPIVVFFDQFEEFFIYVYNQDRPKGREFIADIGRLYHNDASRVHVVFSMREEFFVEMDAFRDEIPTVFHNECNLRLRGFEKEQARDAIVYPLRAFNIWIEADLVERIIADLSQTSGVGSGQIESAQLQIVCDTLWARKKGDRITLADYLELGGEDEKNIAGRLLVERLFESLAEINTPDQLNLLERLLPLLRTAEGTKYVRQIQDLAQALKTEEAPLRELLDKLVLSRFIRSDHRSGLELIELAHDYLVEHLEDFQLAVRTILPRRALLAVMHRSTVGSDLATKEELETIAPAIDEMDISRKEAELLFCSTIALDRPLLCFFTAAIEHGIPVWTILHDRIFSGVPTEAAKIFRSIGDLALQAGETQEDTELPPEAFELVLGALGDDERSPAAQILLAELMTAQRGVTSDKARIMLLNFIKTSIGTRSITSDAIYALGSVESPEALSLVEKALPREPAQDALVRLVTAKNPDVALHARELAIQFVRAALAGDQPPFSAIRALGEIESLESLALVRQAMAHPELIRTAQAIIEKRFLKSKDEQVAAAARQAMAEHYSTDKPSSSRFVEEFATQIQRRQSAADVPTDIATWERILQAVLRAKCVLFVGPGVHSPPSESSEHFYPEEERPPLGVQLADMLANESGFLSELPNEDIHSLPRVAEWYELRFGRRALVERIRSTLNSSRPSPVVRALAALPFAIVVTVCFDELFETALRDFQKVPTVRIYDPKANEPTKDFDDDPEPDKPAFFKIHGCVTEPDSIVVTDEDFMRFSLRMAGPAEFSPVPSTIDYSMVKWPSLLVGWSFRDYHLRFLWRLLRYKRDTPPLSYVIDPYPDRLFAESAQHDRSLVLIKEDIWTCVAQLYKAVMGVEAPL